MDNFKFNGKHYLIIVDQFSKFTIVKQCKDLTSKTTISILLEVFSEHGIPLTIRSDHGCNFMSSHFVEFAKHLNISITLSSAFHHSSNPTEYAVKMVKSLKEMCFSWKHIMACCPTRISFYSLVFKHPFTIWVNGRQFGGLLLFFQEVLLQA